MSENLTSLLNLLKDELLTELE